MDLPIGYVRAFHRPNAGGVSQNALLHKYEVPNCHILVEGALSVWNFSFGVMGSYIDRNGQW